MSWRDEIRVGSFRGVPFSIASADRGGLGRRVVVDEIPGSERPQSQELGRALETISVDAFVSGSDYLDRRDALIAALRVDTPGELILPWRSRILARATDACRVRESSDRGGVASFSLVFVDSGEDLSPTQVADAQVAAENAASTASTASTATTTAAVATVNAHPAHVRAAYTAAAAADAAAVAAALGGLTVATSTDVRRLVEVAALSPSSLALGLSTAEEIDLVAAVAAALRATRIAAIERVLVLVIGGDAAFDTADAAAAASDEIAAILEADLDDIDDRDEWIAVLELRSALVVYLRDRAGALPQIRTVTIPEPTPSIVVAWDLYADATRDGEIVDRNAVEDPSFVSGAIEVLTS